MSENIIECAKIELLYDLSHSLSGEYLKKYTYPWEALGSISDMIIEIGNSLDKNEYTMIGENVWVANDAVVAKSAAIGAPCIIGHKTEVRHCAYIRGSALIGDGCVVGNSVELKNCILFDGVQVPHYNYVGDSILGYKSHMGAGSITSNVRSDKAHVIVKCKESGVSVDTGRKKVGAALGDFVEVGCNAVLNPGTVLGKNSSVYPTSCVRGAMSENSIYKNSGEVIKKNI